MFAVTVMANPLDVVAQPVSLSEQPVACGPKDSITEVKVFLNTDLEGVAALDKVKLIQTASKSLQVKDEHISLRLEQPYELADPSVSTLVSGLGDSRKNLLSPASFLSWVVGCGAVKSHQMDVLEKLETIAKDGSLSKNLGRGVSSWQVTIKKSPIATNRRLKRQIRATSTPSPTGGTTGTQATLHSQRLTSY